MSMAAVERVATRAPGRAAARFVQTRLRSSGSKVPGEEERAAENVYIKEAKSSCSAEQPCCWACHGEDSLAGEAALPAPALTPTLPLPCPLLLWLRHRSCLPVFLASKVDLDNYKFDDVIAEVIIVVMKPPTQLPLHL